MPPTPSGKSEVVCDPGPPTIPTDLHEHVARAVHEGGRRLATDSDFAKPFWDNAVKHGGKAMLSSFKTWIGGLLMMAIVGGGFGALVIYAVKVGWIKG